MLPFSCSSPELLSFGVGIRPHLVIGPFLPVPESALVLFCSPAPKYSGGDRCSGERGALHAALIMYIIYIELYRALNLKKTFFTLTHEVYRSTMFLCFLNPKTTIGPYFVYGF